MIRTEYTRQVPIRHHQLTVGDAPGNSFAMVITGYKVQRAWMLTAFDTLTFAEEKALFDRIEQGQDVEGFEWIDIPVKE
jgi:hypothetical protein